MESDEEKKPYGHSSLVPLCLQTQNDRSHSRPVCPDGLYPSYLNGAHMNSSLVELHLRGIARSNDASN